MKNKRTIICDEYEYGILANALNEFRNNLIKDKKEVDKIDEFLLKVVNIPIKNDKVNVKVWIKHQIAILFFIY